MYRLLLTTVLLVVGLPLQAAVYTAASANPTDVNTAIALASSSGGDVVQVPAGSVNVTSQILINKPLSLIFYGTVYSNSMPANASPSAEAMIQVQCNTNGLFRVSGLTMHDGTAAPSHADAGAIRLTGWGTQVRVDHIYSDMDHQIPITPYGPIGVADHCIISPLTSLNQPFRVAHPSFMGQGSFGDYSWAVGPMYGTSNAWYFEDCLITNRNQSPFVEGMSLDAQDGARYVLRHCVVVSCYIGGHGTETTQRERGIRMKEVYDNDLIGRISAGGVISELGHFRSGSGIITGNRFYNAQSAFTVRVYRLTSNTTPWGPADANNAWDVNDPTIYLASVVTAGSGGGVMNDLSQSWTAPNQWNNFTVRNVTTSRASLVNNGTTTATSINYSRDTFNNYMTFTTGDSYQFRRVVHVLDSPGRGTGMLMSNTTPVINGIAQWPNEVLEPIYCWSNTYVNVANTSMGNGGFYPVTVDVAGAEVMNTNPPGGTWTRFTYPHPLVTGNSWYVSTNGSASGDGSINNPWNITTAIKNNTVAANSNHVIQAGDTIYLRDGEYGTGSNSVFIATLQGSPGNPVTIKGFPNERPKINGGLTTTGGNWIDIMGFEIYNSYTNRTSDSGVRWPGLSLDGHGCRAINMVVHDTGQPGIASWGKVMGDTEDQVYGNIVWGNGIYSLDPGFAPGTPRGDGFYMQNTNGVRNIVDNILCRNLTFGIKTYGEQGQANGFNYRGNVMFGNGTREFLILGIHFPVTNFVYDGNYLYTFKENTQPSLQGEFPVPPVSDFNNYNARVANSVFASEAGFDFNYLNEIHAWSVLTHTNNTYIQSTTNSTWKNNFVFWEIDPTNVVSYNINRDTFYGNKTSAGLDGWRYDHARRTFAQIQGLGYELNGSYITNLPATNIIVLRTNKYEVGRAHLIVYNYLSNLTASVNISSVGLSSGQPFSVQDVQNYYGSPVYSGVYNPLSPTITIPLDGTNVTPLIGTITNFSEAGPNVHTPITFNTFVILPTSSSPTNDPIITAQPQNKSVTVGSNATWTVTASGTPILHFLWTFNGSSVGTDSSSYTRTNCQIIDSGKVAQVTVTNLVGSVVSSSASLTVNSLTNQVRVKINHGHIKGGVLIH